MSNLVKEQLKAGRVSHGVWIDAMNVELVEVCGSLGYDFAVLDAEHQMLDATAYFELVRACQRTGMVPMVRVSVDDAGVIRAFLEVGCKGVYVPHVKTGAQARRLVDAVKRAPEVTRNHGAVGRRDSVETQVPPDDDVMIFVLVEEMEGIDNLDDIISTDGVDVVAIGTTDLAKDMGYAGSVDHPDVTRTVLDAQRKILAGGGAVEALVRTAAEAEDAITAGALVVVVSVKSVTRNALAQVLNRTGSQSPARTTV